MAQEQFAGPEQYTEFDPEKFIRDLKIQAEEAAKEKAAAQQGAQQGAQQEAQNEDKAGQ